MPPTDVEAVIRAARAGRTGTPELFHALADATLLLATKEGADGATLPFVFEWNDADHGAIFTSAPLTAMLPTAPGFTEFAGRELGRRWPDGLRAVINPGTDDLMLVFDDAAMHLVAAPEDAVELPPPGPGGNNGNGRPAMPAGEQYAVGAPAAAPPEDLVDALRSAVRASAFVESVYLFQLAEGGQPPRLVAGAVLAPGADERPAMTALVNAAAQLSPAAARLDFLVLDGAMLRDVAQHVQPIS